MAQIIAKKNHSNPLSKEAVMVALGIIPIEFNWLVLAPRKDDFPIDIPLDKRDSSGIGHRTRIFVRNGFTSIEVPIAKISRNYFDLLSPTQELSYAQAKSLATQYVFMCLGGSEKQYPPLKIVANIHKNGEESKYLPPGIKLNRSRSFLTQRINEVAVVKRNNQDYEILRVDTSSFHKRNSPFLNSDGLSLETISLTLIAGVPRNLIDSSSYAVAYCNHK